MNRILLSGTENIRYKKKAIKTIILLVLEYFGEKKCEVSISFVNSEEIRELNKNFRKIDKPTDVLSFPQRETGGKGFFNSGILGDIVISYTEVVKNAEENNVSTDREFKIILTHGILHLLGFDHVEIEDEKEMFALQEKIVSELLEKVEM